MIDICDVTGTDHRYCFDGCCAGLCRDCNEYSSDTNDDDN